MTDDPDDTVIVRTGPARRSGRAGAVALVGLILVAVGAGAWWLMPQGSSPPPLAASERVPLPALEAIPLASEAAIGAANPAARAVLRFAAAQAVVVIDFPTLAEQGRMLNRLAAYSEKAGLAHDRVPTEETMAAAVAASGVTADTYYYGHDYSAASVARFFARAAEAHMTLRPEEEDLKHIAARAASEPAGFGAVITVVRADADNGVSAQARATILHHELSHGEYFTNPVYATFVTSFWDNVLTSPERAAFRLYLAHEGYDDALEDLMRNEMQAYLMHTPDPTFFQPSRLAISAARLAQIRAEFLAGMPAGWLRDAVLASGIVPATPNPALPITQAAPPRKRRRVQRAGSVSIGSAVAATVPPRRRSALIAV